MKTWHAYLHPTKKTELVPQGLNWKYVFLGVLSMFWFLVLPLALAWDKCHKQAWGFFFGGGLLALIARGIPDPEEPTIELIMANFAIVVAYVVIAIVVAKNATKWREAALIANGYTPLGYTIEANTRKEVFSQIAETTKKLEAAKNELDQGLAEAFAVMDDPNIQAALKYANPETQKTAAAMQKQREQFLKEQVNT